MQKISAYGFTWQYRESGGQECWEIVLPDGTGLPHFAVKNYGNTSNTKSGFSGWRVVSGGPFTQAGGWTTRDDAMKGAAPWIRNYYRECIPEKLEQYHRSKRALEQMAQTTLTQ